MGKYILEMRNITKTFPGVKALDNVKQGYYNPKEHKPFVFNDARVKEIGEMLKSNKNMLLDDNVE